MLAPTWPEVALLLTLTGRFGILFLRRFVPVVHIIRSSKRGSRHSCRTPLGKRIRDFIWEVLLQAKVIRERPLPGLAHAFVFWGFLAFALVSINHFANGFGRSFFTEESVFGAFYFALRGTVRCFVIVSMVGLGIRRFIVQPKWLGALSPESGIITILILILMVTYLFGYGVLREGTPALGPTGGSTPLRF